MPLYRSVSLSLEHVGKGDRLRKYLGTTLDSLLDSVSIASSVPLAGEEKSSDDDGQDVEWALSQDWLSVSGLPCGLALLAMAAVPIPLDISTATVVVCACVPEANDALIMSWFEHLVSLNLLQEGESASGVRTWCVIESVRSRLPLSDGKLATVAAVRRYASLLMECATMFADGMASGAVSIWNSEHRGMMWLLETVAVASVVKPDKVMCDAVLAAFTMPQIVGQFLETVLAPGDAVVLFWKGVVCLLRDVDVSVSNLDAALLSYAVSVCASFPSLSPCLPLVLAVLMVFTLGYLLLSSCQRSLIATGRKTEGGEVVKEAAAIIRELLADVNQHSVNTLASVAVGAGISSLPLQVVVTGVCGVAGGVDHDWRRCYGDQRVQGSRGRDACKRWQRLGQRVHHDQLGGAVEGPARVRCCQRVVRGGVGDPASGVRAGPPGRPLEH
jgi:hypothetical protein